MVDAFIPEELPPFPPLELAPLVPLIAQAQTALGRLDAASNLLPDADLFLYSFIRREAVLSSQIEGTRSSISDLLLYELDDPSGVPVDDVVEVSNYVNALNYAVNELGAGSSIDAELLCRAHGILMQSARGSDKEPGQLRSRLNWINGRHPAYADYVPPPPAEVPAAMQALTSYINALDPHTPTIIKAGLAHVQFESIHPFLDGNGRLGRLLISLMLHREQVLHNPILYLSLYLKQHRSTYYYLLEAVRTRGAWETWLDFFVDGVRSTAETAADMARRLSDRVAADRRTIQRSLKRNASAQAVHYALAQRPIHSIRGLANDAGISTPSASGAVQRLVELGLAREITGRRRNRLYSYPAYIDILNEDLEPL